MTEQVDLAQALELIASLEARVAELEAASRRPRHPDHRNTTFAQWHRLFGAPGRGSIPLAQAVAEQQLAARTPVWRDLSPGRTMMAARLVPHDAEGKLWGDW
jgi:hypothetical protein